MTAMGWVILTLVGMALISLAPLLVYRRGLMALWREPVLRHPVVIFESDDWGAGPQEQTAALTRLHDCLATVSDQTGRHPVMTLGVVLASPDGARITASGGCDYASIPLSAPYYDALRTAMHRGQQAGVFYLQLHGMEHFWPPSLMRWASEEPQWMAWLQSPTPGYSEDLPSPLQSRWTDASTLPSQPLAADVIAGAVADEANEFRASFAVVPKVAVATTFIWNDAVEQAWAANGIEVVITPGTRYTCRDAAGRPAGQDKQMRTGESASTGLCYLVRDVYFEPARGHSPTQLLSAVRQRALLGRAALVETHRINFVRDAATAESSFCSLAEALALLVRQVPGVRFITPWELACAIRNHDNDWVESRINARMTVWLGRISELPGFTRYAKLTGLWLVIMLARHWLGERWHPHFR